MATYEELLKSLDDYNPQQQQLGVNSFGGGMPQQQQLTPYEQMMRERFGTPETQTPQESSGLLGSIFSSSPAQQQNAEEPSYLGSFMRGAVQQGLGVLGGQADFLAGATGSETLRDLGNSAQNIMQGYSRPKEYTYDEITKNGLSSIKDYLLDPNGFAFDVGGGFGSSGTMMAEAALLSAALPAGAATAGTGAIATLAGKLGLKSVAAALKGGGTAAKLIKNVIASTPLEAASESGGTFREMTTDENGNPIDLENIDMDKVQTAMAKNFVGNLGVLGASNLLESAGIGRLFGDKMRQGILGKVRDIGAFMATNVGQNAWEEGAQTGSNLYAQGKIDNISQIVNPFEWNPEQVDAATIGGIAGFGQGAALGGAGHVMNRIAGNQQDGEQAPNPNFQINNAVTNNEFGDAVAIAKHDTSTNLVDRMRNLEGRIGYHASDGTNCARTVGLALAGTDYQDLINVDNFVEVAQNKGQLKDPANYVPKPGDLAVVNDGNHIVMVSENGGTIQNGSSHDGVYESAQSPLQMFGSVKYYISTSELSNGDYGVAGNLQGVNEEQRQEEYYQNLIKEEQQRRADAIREVLGAKTHAQEQQEQAVSEAEQYQRDNAPEIAPISDYRGAFTQQELASMTPEQHEALNNAYNDFVSDKNNVSRTLAETVQTMRGYYNELIGNRQATQTVAPTTQQQPVQTPTPTRQSEAPTQPVVKQQPTQVQQKQAQPMERQNVEQPQAATQPQPVASQQTQQNAPQQPTVQQNRPAAETATTASTTEAQPQAQPTTENVAEQEEKLPQDDFRSQTGVVQYQPTEAEREQAKQDIAQQHQEQLISSVRNNRKLLNTAKAARRGVKSAVKAMESQPQEVRNAVAEVLNSPREQFIDLLNDDLSKKKKGLKKEESAPLTAQANQAFRKGLQLLNEGKSVEEAFDAVKNDISDPKAERKAAKEREKTENKKAKQKVKGEGQNVVTEQKSEELQESETSESGNQNINTESEEGRQEQGESSESTKNQNEAEVRENGSYESGLSELSERETAGTVRKDAAGREAGAVSANEDGTGEALLQTNDEAVRNRPSEQRDSDAGGLSGRTENVRGESDGQDAFRGRLHETLTEFNNTVNELYNDYEDDKVDLQDVKDQVDAQLDELEKQIDKVEEERQKLTPNERTERDYENHYKHITVKIGDKEYKPVIYTGSNGKEVIRWATSSGRLVDRGEKRPLGVLLWYSLIARDFNSGKYPTLNQIAKYLENRHKKSDLREMPKSWQEAIKLAKQFKKEKKELSVVDTTPDANTEYNASTVERSGDEQIKRSLDELITEAKRAFKNAKNFRINRDNLIFTMPNGLEMTVNIKDQIILNAADEAKARKEHGLNEGGIVVEGYAKRLDKGALVALSRESGTGTAYHEAFHTVWDWVLNDKEKAAMLKHFKPIAEKLGVAVDEAMADGYRDWKLARQQHKGTIFGKLFQKIKDFIDSARAVLTGAENVNNVYRQIESGRVWNRDAKGRFAKAEDSDKQFLVTNKKITGDTRIPVVDITSNPKFDRSSQNITKTVKALMKDDEGNPIRFTLQGEGPIGRIASVVDGKHLFSSSNKHKSNINSSARQRALSDLRTILESAIYVDKHADTRHGSGTKYIELYAVAGNKNDNTLTRFRIVAKEGDPGSGQFEVSDVKFYDIIKDGIVSASPSKIGGSKVTTMPSNISVAELLDGVKDKNGKDYVTDGKLNYEPGVIKTSIRQQYSSADTSLNQVPAVFKKVNWKSGTTNIDIGGGKYDTSTNFMKDKGVTNVVFDPFNRDAEHNRNAFEKIQSKGDTVTVANVLNVIKEDVVRDNVILQAAKALKPNGTAYFGIYEGNASGNGKETSKGWQNNRKTADYIPEIAKRFKTIKKSGNMIIASNPIVNQGETAEWSMDASGNETVRYSIRPSDTPLQRTQKLQEQADRYNTIELNAVTAKDPTARQYMKDVIVKRQLQGLTKKAEKAEAKKRAEKYADDLLEKLDGVVAMVEKVAKRFPAMQDWQNRPIVTITKEERERLKKEKAFRNDVMYRVIDENGKVEPVVNAFKNNAEYPINMDFGTLCMKKEAIDAVVQILVDKGKGQNLGPTQNEMLKDLLREFGYAVPCDVCFVETKRERMLPDANKTAYAWESVLKAAKIDDGKEIGERTSFTEEQEKRLKEMAGLVKGKTFKQAYEEYMPQDRRRTKTNGDKGTDLDTGITSTAAKKLAKLFLEDPALAGKLKPTTIITSKGTDDLIRIYGGHTNIKNVLSGLYGSANAKPIEGFSVYDALSWILMDNDAVTKDWDKLIDMGGGRVQSFSDYNPLLFLEYIQMVVDYQARNMPMHAYTKVPMFARLFGKTGIMINMSFVPEIIKDEHDTLDEKGKLVHAGLKYNPKTSKFDLYAWHKDSFPIEEALEIRKDKGYAKHVGTIAVGVSDEHIKKMMADPEIDMIIPYHKSGMPAAVQNKTGLKYAKDYTDFQNPGITDEAKEEIVKRLANGDAKAFEKKYGEGAESYLKNRYLNYSRLLVKEGTPEKAAQEYLNRCKDLGCTPVFEMFAYKDGNKEAGIVAPGYYKMLEDFRGYDSEMNPIMQGPVRLYSTDENGEKHLNLPDNVEELLTDSLADRTAQLESLEQLKNNKEFWRKADKLMEMQRADGEVRKAMVDRLSSALGSQNVKTLENGAFLDELEKLYKENGMSEESAKEKVEMFRRFDGAVYGFAKGGAIYLNENYFNANTPAHEFTHIWAKVAQTKNEALWKKGVALLEKTEEWNKVVKDPLYENIIGNKDAIASEVLARIVGERNADFIRDELLDPAKKQGRGEGLWAQIRAWMKDIFKSIRSVFDPIKGRRLTYDEFTKMPLKALWDTSEHEQFRESLSELAQQQERADEVHADAIELQVKPGNETAVTIKDGMFTKGPHKGEAVKFADAILDGDKRGETRPKKTLPRNKWVGINRDGEIIGRVKFGDPIEITKESAEYNDAMIKNTDYDMEDGQTKWYYPIIDKQDFRKNPIKSEFYSQALRQYELPLAQQKQAVREQYEGTDKWMKAPNGKPTNLTEDQWVTVQTPQFKEWFGDSKVVDENGDPLVVYHGSNANIESFDTNRGGEGTARWGKGAYFATGYGTAETYAKERTLGNGGEANVIPCFLKAENIFDNEMGARDIPKTKNTAWQKLTDFLKEHNIDLPYIIENSRPGVAAGIAARAFGGDRRYGSWEANAKFREKLQEFGFDGISANLEDGTEYVVFNANQIKDASGNNVSITKDSDNIHYSITSAASKAIDKAEAYVNRNVRKPNMQTAEGRASDIFNNTYNNNKAQTWVAWLKDRRDKFYREWIDKNEALHRVDEFIQNTTGKKLKEEDKIYNRVQVARALANGAADTLVQGSEEAFNALRDSIGKGVDPKDTAAVKRAEDMRKEFKYATVQQALEPIMKKDMDQKYPDYLAKHGINTWRDAFSNYLGARRILELVRLVEDKSLQNITHDRKEFTDFINKHPEYEAFRPKPFSKVPWRKQVQDMAKVEPKLAEQMAKELAKTYKFPKGVSRADLEALVNNAPKEFAKSADIYYQLQRNLLILMEDGHLIPGAIRDKVNTLYKDYCPLMIDYSDTAGLEQAISQFGKGADSIANVNSMLKHVLSLGSERGLISPLESTYKSIQMLTERAERNKVAVHFVKMVANSPELQKTGLLEKVPGKSADAKNCIFTVLMNGEKVAFRTTQEMYGPIVGYDIPAAGIVEGVCRSAAQTLRYGATTSPSFIIRNFIRDTIFAGVSSRNGFVPVIDSFKGMWAYLHNKELRGEFDAMGITAYNYFGSGKNAVRSMDELMGEKDMKYLKDHPLELIKELIKLAPKKFEAWSEIVEASTRMGEYMKARQSGKSMQEAALDARDVTLDFSRSGFYGQRVNMMVPFFNACIQGGDKMYRLLNSKDPATRMRTMRMIGIYIMLPSMICWIFNHDEPWYEELDPHIRMNNWILPGGKIRIPKPQEAGILFGSGLESIMDKMYTKEPHAWKNWFSAMKEVLIPNIIPTLGLPMLEWATNYSLFREKAIEGNRLKRLPVEMRYNSSTTEVSKLVGKATGLSPVKLDNTIRGYTGTLGMLAAQSADMLFEEKRNLPSRPITERAMVRDFFLNSMNMNRTSEDFYDLVNASQQQHAGYGKKGSPTPAVKAINKALRDVSKQQKDIQTITNARNISPDRKRQLIDRKREIIKTIQQTTLKRYRDKFDV